MSAMDSESKTNNTAHAGRMPRLVRVVAWVEIMGKRAETTFLVESPWVRDGACPVLQRKTDESVAQWVFQSQAKSGLEVSPVCELCGGVGYYEGGIKDGEPCKFCHPNKEALPPPVGSGEGSTKQAL